jgi:hypothetical protein
LVYCEGYAMELHWLSTSFTCMKYCCWWASGYKVASLVEFVVSPFDECFQKYCMEISYSSP